MTHLPCLVLPLGTPASIKRAGGTTTRNRGVARGPRPGRGGRPSTAGRRCPTSSVGWRGAARHGSAARAQVALRPPDVICQTRTLTAPGANATVRAHQVVNAARTEAPRAATGGNASGGPRGRAPHRRDNPASDRAAG